VVVTQQQTQHGCCSGSGCGPILAVLIVLGLLGAVYSALKGEYGTGWQVAAWVGALIVILGIAAALKEKMGRGNAEYLQDEQPNETPPRINLSDQTAEPANLETPTSERPRLGHLLPHPDDPQPPALEKPEEEPEVTSPAPAETQGVPRPDVYEEIRKLAQLRDEGLITVQEFEQKKGELLDRI
jgi:hypothetical protein